MVLAFSTSSAAFAFACVRSAWIPVTACLYASILFGVLSPVSVFSSIGVKAAAAPSNAVFCSSVAASTNLNFAFNNAVFLVLTFTKASATSSGVASGFAISVSASVTARSASAFAASYLSAVSFVFPAVTFSVAANAFSASFAFVNSVVFALSFNKPFAASSFAFSSSTFANATVASAFVALLVLAFSTSSAALAFACVRSAWIPVTACLYASILFGVLSPVSVSSVIGVNAASAFFNSATWSSVALSTKASLFSFKAANFSSNFLTAAATASGSGLSWSNKACSSFWACFASSLAIT